MNSKMGHPQIAWTEEYINNRSSPNINLSQIGFDKNIGTPLVVFTDGNYNFNHLKEAIISQNKEKWFNFSEHSLETMGMMATSSSGSAYFEGINFNFYQGVWVDDDFWFRDCEVLLIGESRWNNLNGNFYFTS